MKLLANGEVVMLKVSENVPAKLVCMVMLLDETVYFTKPCPLPGVLAPISLAK